MENLNHKNIQAAFSTFILYPIPIIQNQRTKDTFFGFP
jgi:hypothetical protein